MKYFRLSKNQQVELTFKTGEIILVYGDMDGDGFYMGELDGVRGLVPSNFLAEAVSDHIPNDSMKLILNYNFILRDLKQTKLKTHPIPTNWSFAMDHQMWDV